MPRLGRLLLSAAGCLALLAEPLPSAASALAAFTPAPFSLSQATPGAWPDSSGVPTTRLLPADASPGAVQAAHLPPAGSHAPALRLDALSRNVQSALTTWLALREDLRPRLQLYQSEYSRLSLSLSHRLKGVRLKYKYSFW